MTDDAWRIVKGEGPIVAAAIHDGHFVRDNLRALLALSDSARLTEEDPCTGSWTEVFSTRIVGLRSRFEVDLNRPRDSAIYLHPADAWGLKVWNKELPDQLVRESLQLYDGFYEEVRRLLSGLVAEHKRLVVYDLHTYNHRRSGPYAEFDDANLNPAVNLGTGTMDRRRWSKVVDRFMAELRNFSFPGLELDVRENVKFLGGHFAKWIHHEFAESVCVLSIEFKKFFMDEWTGEADLQAQSDAIQAST